jgi:hypothetical protein
MAPPEPKKRKAVEEDASSCAFWRNKCIEKFLLRPVPDGWKNQVAEGSEEAWKQYYRYRTARESKDDHDQVYNDGDEELIQSWKKSMRRLIKKTFGKDNMWKWPHTLRGGNMEWEDCDELRSSQYFGYIWSPYAIPHAIVLEHRRHFRTRMSSVEFHTTWGYILLDLEDDISEDDDEEAEFKTLCSDCFKDEELRLDVIKHSHLNQTTISRLRKFLFGTNKPESKEEICDEYSFLLLLFGSMGTFDFQDLAEGHIGYEWCPEDGDAGVREKMIRDGVIEDEEEAYEVRITWLEHRMRHVTGNLGAIHKYYTPPSIQDAHDYDIFESGHLDSILGIIEDIIGAPIDRRLLGYEN